MPAGWLREAQTGLAVDRILDAAARAFVEQGVSATGMADIARRAGCSRATLYRYFPTRHALHLAYVERSAVEIAARVEAEIAAIESPAERLVEGIVRSLRAVRADPATAAWFHPGESGTAARVSRGSEVVDAIAGAFAERLTGPEGEAGAHRLAARWVVRVIVSLLSLPGESEAEERELVARFVVPSLLPSGLPPPREERAPW